MKPGWVRVGLPYYASEEDVEFILSAIEFVADHGRDFVPEYRFGWLDGVWRHIERPMTDVKPLELTVDALLEAAQSFAAGDHETPMSASQLRQERRRYFEEAKKVAEALEQKWLREPPVWNPPTGQAEIDAMRWFDYVHTDDPWHRVPDQPPDRPMPVRCGGAPDAKALH